MIQLLSPVAALFTRDRIGTPQIVALIFLFAFLAQCAFLALRMPPSEAEISYAHQGRLALRGEMRISDSQRSPLPYLIAAAGAPSWKTGAIPEGLEINLPPSPQWQQLRARLPFILCGALLGASLWYVARRLYGNAGGYIALALFSFSPLLITHSSTAQPEILAAWGMFATIFTGIAVAHTLYAPREVVLWNWRRILLLGCSIALAVGAHFAAAVAVLIALAFMLYLAPERRAPAVVILLAACGVALVLLWAAYLFHVWAMVAGLRQGQFFGFLPSQFAQGITWRLLAIFLLRNGGSVVVLLLVGLVTFAVWPRARFFGNAAPLLVFALLIVLGIAMPHQAGYAFFLYAVPFAFVFIAGICADLLETRRAGLALGMIVGILAANAISNLMALARLMRG